MYIQICPVCPMVTHLPLTGATQNGNTLASHWCNTEW